MRTSPVISMQVFAGTVAASPENADFEAAAVGTPSARRESSFWFGAVGIPR